jgi:hypothetical protein
MRAIISVNNKSMTKSLQQHQQCINELRDKKNPREKEKIPKASYANFINFSSFGFFLLAEREREKHRKNFSPLRCDVNKKSEFAFYVLILIMEICKVL